MNTVGITRPAQQLTGFARAEMAGGERRTLTLEVHVSQLASTNAHREVAVEPGAVDVFVGLDSDDRALTGHFQVSGSPRVVAGVDRSFLSTAITTTITSKG